MFDPVDWLRRRAFTPATPDRTRIGAEVELLALDADTGLPVEVADRLLPFLTRWAMRRGGAARTAPKGGIRVDLADGAVFAIEPGGQLELASAPCPSPSALLRALDDVLQPLAESASDAGIDLFGLGIDPFNGPAAAPLQVVAERYCRMDAYFESVGPAGRRMMRQTAAVQVNVDPVGPADLAWRALNAAAPYLTALFANSRHYAGHDTGFASFRAETWRHADPLRTGVIEERADPAAAYAAFALAAPVMHATPAGEYRPFADWVRTGKADEGAWEEHLTTLFPEVRPKRYLEVRSMDAQPIEHLALPVLVCAGLAMDPVATAATRDLIGPADPGLLSVAGRLGLTDPLLADRCRDLVAIALAGCARLGEDRCSREDIERACALADRKLAGVPA